jgi:uncharacterized protein (DUF2141 family)
MIYTFFLGIFCYFSYPNYANLSVKIEKIPSDKGKIMIALYDSKKNYMNVDKALSKKIAKIKNGTATIDFGKVPFGKYAFVLFHDKNNDDKLNKNLLGIPTEDYAFSNNARGTFGAPSFESSSFVVNKENQNISISLK